MYNILYNIYGSYELVFYRHPKFRNDVDFEFNNVYINCEGYRYIKY